MKSKIYVVSETMEESQIVSGVLLRIIAEHKLDAEIVSVTSGQYFDQMVVCVPSGPADCATVGFPAQVADGAFITVCNPESRPINIGTGAVVWTPSA